MVKADAARTEEKQCHEIAKLERSMDTANEEIKRCQQLHEKEKSALQDKLNMVGKVGWGSALTSLFRGQRSALTTVVAQVNNSSR